MSLHAAVVSARLTGARAALFGGIEPSLVDGLPICESQSAQILSDLHGLNGLEQLDGGAVPFERWLGNALALAGQRLEAEVFRVALHAAEATTPVLHQSPVPESSTEDDAIALELSRIARAVVLARAGHLTRSLYEVDALLAKHPHHVEARLLRERISRGIEAERLLVWSHRGAGMGSESRGAYRGTLATKGMAASLERSNVSDPLASPDRLAHFSRFVGRAREIAFSIMRADPGRVLIHGLAGTGKTALALALVRTLTPRYPDLQVSVELRGTSEQPLSTDAAMRKIVAALLPIVPLPEASSALVELYRTVFKGQRALVFLEDARDAAQIEALLPPEGSACIVTSRRRFALPGAVSLALGALDESDARDLLQGLVPRLGVDAVGRLVEICAGLPLALKLAGGAMSRRRDFTPEAYADRLREALSRQGLIDGMLEVSFALLDPVLQLVWSYLGLLTSSFDLEDAVELIDASPEIEADLSELVAHGMIDHDPGTKLYRFPRAGRSLARSRLSTGDGADALRRRDLATEASRRLPSMDALSPPELANLLGFARRTRQRQVEAFCVEELAKLAAYSGSGAELAEQALGVWRALGDRAGERRSLNLVVEIHRRLRSPSRAIEFAEQSLIFARAHEDRDSVRHALILLGDLHETSGDLARAIALGEEVVTLSRSLRRPEDEGSTLKHLAELHERAKDGSRALAILEQLFASARERGSYGDQITNALSLARASERLGDMDRAIVAMQSCVDLVRSKRLFSTAERYEAEIARLRARCSG